MLWCNQEPVLSNNPVELGDRTRSIENVAGDSQYFQRPPCIERWLRNRVPTTRKHYLSYMARFQILTGFTPERFLEWCKTVESVEVQDLIDRTSIEFKPAIQFCYRVALRSFLTHNGYNSLPKTDLQYVSQAWHRGYRRHEIQTLLGQLRQKHHKLFVVMAAESGLRSHVLMDLRYRHVKEDLENGTAPVAVRLEPRFHIGKKAAGYTFLGPGSVRLLEQCVQEGTVETRPEGRLVPRSYFGVWAAIHRANRRAGLDPKIQTCHGLRKYFENALDDANIDHEKKMIVEGHLGGTRARHYTDRDIEQLRDVYKNAYRFIQVEHSYDEFRRVRDVGLWKRIGEVEARLAKQELLEARLTLIADELRQMKESRAQVVPMKH